MEDEIEFEDLHGERDGDPGHDIEVDLDEQSGVTPKARVSTPADGGGSLDDPDFDDLPSNRRDKPASQDDPGDGGEGGDADSKKRNKFDARLKREQRAKKRERERVRKLEEENQKLQARLRRSSQTSSAEQIKQLESDIASTEAELEKAIEDGSSAKEQVRLSSRLTDLKAKRIAADYTRDDDDPDDVGADDGRSTQPSGNPLTREFLDQHADWYNQPGYEKYTRTLRKLDRAVFAEGFDPRDEDYFEELQERLQQEAPELFDEDGELDVDGIEERREALKADRAKDKRGRTTVAPGENGSVSRTPGGDKPVGNKVTLTKEDYATMRKFGLDTKDPAVIKEFARNKRQRMLEEQANG